MFSVQAKAWQLSEKNWLIPNKTLKISNGTCSLMTREISCNQMKQITVTWNLESDSNQRAVHWSIQHHMMARSTGREEKGRAENSPRNPLCINYVKLLLILLTGLNIHSNLLWLIRDGGSEGMGIHVLPSTCYIVTTGMTALRWAAVWDIWTFH